MRPRQFQKIFFVPSFFLFVAQKRKESGDETPVTRYPYPEGRSWTLAATARVSASLQISTTTASSRIPGIHRTHTISNRRRNNNCNKPPSSGESIEGQFKKWGKQQSNQQSNPYGNFRSDYSLGIHFRRRRWCRHLNILVRGETTENQKKNGHSYNRTDDGTDYVSEVGTRIDENILSIQNTNEQNATSSPTGDAEKFAIRNIIILYRRWQLLPSTSPSISSRPSISSSTDDADANIGRHIKYWKYSHWQFRRPFCFAY